MDHDLDSFFRREGWGLVTDLALNIKPSDVESQARQVARWAFKRIKELEASLDEVLGDASAMHTELNWYGPFSEYDYDSVDGSTVSIEWPNLAVSARDAMGVLMHHRLPENDGPWWHACNPWKDKIVYLTLDEIASIMLYQIDWKGRHGDKLDAYLLPTPDPETFSAGVRFGPNGEDYVSLSIDQFRAQELHTKKMREKAV